MHHGEEIGYVDSGLVTEWERPSTVCHPYVGTQKVVILFLKEYC